MAAWKCDVCKWTNAGSWSKCAKCNSDKLTDEEHRLLAQCQPVIDRVLAKIQRHRFALIPKWDYLQVTSKDLEDAGGLAHLGNDGWELVAVSTYSEGGTVLFTNAQVYSIHALYVFKRLRPSIPADLLQELDEIAKRLTPNLRSRLRLLYKE